MALWTVPTKVIEIKSLATFIPKEVIIETASAAAVATVTATSTTNSYVETASAAAVASVTTVEDYSAGAIAAISGLLPIVDGQMEQSWLGNVIAPLPVVAATISTLGGSVSVLSPILVAGVGYAGLVGTFASTAPLPIVAGVGIQGYSSFADIIAPISVVTAYGADNGAVEAKLPIVASQGLTGRIGQANIITTKATVDGILTQAEILGGTVIKPMPVINGQLESGVVTYGRIAPRISLVNAMGFAGIVGDGAVTLPIQQVSAILLSEVLSTGAVLSPLPIVSGWSPQTIAAFITWVMNTENGRATNYTQFPFIALGQLGSSSMGVAADGIYLLEGSDDAGTAIDATIQFGMADFRAELVDAVDAYVGGTIDADMEMVVTESGQVTDYTYVLAKRDQHARGHHAKLGRGFRSRYRQLSINNVAGADFILDSLTLPAIDVRGNK